MSQSTVLDALVLERLAQMRGALLSAPGPGALMDRLARMVADLPGVSACHIRLDAQAASITNSSMGSRRVDDDLDSDQADPTWASDTGTEPGAHPRQSEKFPLHTTRHQYGEVLLDLEDESAFAPYAASVENTVDLVALQFEAITGDMPDDPSQPQGFLEAVQDIGSRQREQAIRDAQNKALAQLVHAYPLKQVLTTLVRNIELQAGGMVGSILLLQDDDGPRLSCGAAPSLPGEYNAAVEGAPIGPSAGSCGTAAYLKKRVVVEDINTDPLWSDYRGLAIRHGLQACWSQPIINSSGDVLGTFALYYHKPRRPTDQELKLIDSFADVAALAIERTQSEAALRKSERENRALIENAPYCIHQVDLKGRLISMNAAGLRMLELCDERSIVGKVYLDCVSLKDRDRIESLLHGAMNGQASEFEFESMSGRIFASSFIPILGDNREVDRLMGLTQDITERKHAEQERRSLETQLRQSQKMEAIGQLAGGIAHDFNNLLTAILGNAEVLLALMDDGSPARDAADELRTGLAEIQSAGKHAASLTRQLLAFSRREILRAQVIDPRKIIDEMQGFLRRLIGDHICMNVELSIASSCVYADPGQIEQILMNLVVNAVDAMPDGGDLDVRLQDVVLDEIGAKEFENAKPGHYVQLTVTDRGSGMTPETIEHIYEPFFTTKPIGKGTGLGLATVYGTLQQLNGHIRVESQLGVGTTFLVCIPVVEAQSESEKTQTSAADARAKETKETILVCEDEDMVRSVLVRTLGDAGFTVLEAENGPQALKVARTHDGAIDLLISDVVMPEFSGQELANRLALENPETRVLFVSGHSANHLDAQGIQCGQTQLLQKPFGPRALLRRVREVLDAARMIG